ncbi:hypothetical protein Sste5346_004823 [Sporothrix stenoceras]|uniref:Thioredoxin-like fold domain-containing protein n=1 Tax=Sporothrix stenoceras TaxID=5173 RepID=A0ABR3Z739_9PEZI
MACPPHLQFTVLGQGPTTVEIYLGMICPASKRALRTISNAIVPEVIEGGKYFGQVRLLFRLAPHVWHPQGCYVAEHLLGFGRAFCTKPAINERLWFNCFREYMERQREFFDHRVQDESPNSIKERLSVIAGEVVEKAGLMTKEEGAQVMRETLPLNDFRYGGTPLIFDTKYFSRLVRQNGVYAVPTVCVNGVQDYDATSQWSEEQWVEWFERQIAPPNIGVAPQLPPESPPIKYATLALK